MTIIRNTPATLEEAKTGFASALSTGAGYVWFVDDRVFFDCDEGSFYAGFSDSPVDLLAPLVIDEMADRNWDAWRTLDEAGFPRSEGDSLSKIAASLSLFRMSRRALEFVVDAIDAGVTGRIEVVLPTLLFNRGMSVEEIGGRGPFTPLGRRGKYYRRETFVRTGAPTYAKGCVHFPAPRNSGPLGSSRLDVADGAGRDPRLLFVSPVGRGCSNLLPGTLRSFQAAGASIRLINYDGSFGDGVPGAQVIADKGGKWELGRKHVTPESVNDVDYIFFWDDDLMLEGFDPLRFVEIMRRNRLSIAQPGIQSAYPLSHEITKARALPVARWGHHDGGTAKIVGRLTNFVEIMAPVFTREAWCELWRYLDSANISGWGYDYIPLGRKGIIDLMPVVHTRPVQSMSERAIREMHSFLESQGLFRFQPQDYGWLFETMD